MENNKNLGNFIEMVLGKSVKGIIYDVIDDDMRTGIGSEILDTSIHGVLYSAMWREIPRMVFNSVSVWIF